MAFMHLQHGHRIATAASISSSVTSSDGANRSAVGVTALTTSPASRHARRERPASRPRGARRQATARRRGRPRSGHVENGLVSRRPARVRRGGHVFRFHHVEDRQRGPRRERLPPKVVAWSPGRNAEATSARAQHAPIGTPLPSALAIVTTSGGPVGVLEAEPAPGAAEAGLHLVHDQQRFARRTAPERPPGTRGHGCTPPSPCTGSSMTAHTRSSSAASSSAASANAT